MASNVVDIIVRLTDKNAQAGLQKIAATSKGTVAELGKLKGELLAIGAGAGIVGLGAKLAKDALNWNTTVKKLSGITGATAEQSSQLMAVASYMGVSMDDSAAAFAKFSKNVATAKESMANAASQGKESTSVLDKLGLTLNQVSGKNTVEIFKLIQERLRGMKDGAEKTKIEMELFGRTGYQMHAMLNMSAEQMEAVTNRAKEMGLVIDDETAAKSAKLNRELRDLENTGKRLAISIGQELIPVFQDYAQGALDIAKEFESMTAEQKSAIAGIVKFGVEASIVVTVMRSVTSALGFMKLATLAAAGPWITLATVIGLAGKELLNYRWNEKTGSTDLGVTTKAGLEAHRNENDFAPTNEAYAASHDKRYWVSKRNAFGIVTEQRLATREEAAEIDLALAYKSKEEEAKRKQEKELDDAKNELDRQKSEAETAKQQKEAAAEAGKAAKAQQQAATKLTNAVERLSDLYRSLTLQSLEIDGSQYDIDRLQAKNQYESNIKNIQNVIRSLSSTDNGSANGVLAAADAQIGKAYVLGADGTWATDCGKLFADAVMTTFGKDVPRYVPSIIDKAKEEGAWHDVGDGYIPKAGDGIVVLGDNHIVISDGNGGYTGANSSTGVVKKPSVSSDFGNITGYIDTSKLAGYSGVAESDSSSSDNAKIVADSNLVAQVKAKNEEVYQKKLEEAARNQSIRVRKMNEEIRNFDNERLGNRLETINDEAAAQKAQVEDNVRQFKKEVGDKVLAQKRANAEIAKINADAEQKRRELVYQELQESIEHQENLVKLGSLSQLDSDAALAQQLTAYADYAKKQLETAELTAEQRLKIEKNFVDSQQKLWELAGRNLRTSLSEGVRQYNQEVVNYGDLAKGTFDNTLSSINSSFTNHLESMATGAESFGKGLMNIFKEVTNSIIKMLVQLSFQQYLQPKLNGLFGGVVNGFGGGSTATAPRFDTKSYLLNMGSSMLLSGLTGGKGIRGFASGGIPGTGMALVGELGPELVQFRGNSRVYTANETRRLIGNNTGQPNISINIINQSNENLEAKQQNTRFDGENMVVDVVIKAITTNKGGMRDVIKTAAG